MPCAITLWWESVIFTATQVTAKTWEICISCCVCHVMLFNGIDAFCRYESYQWSNGLIPLNVFNGQLAAEFVLNQGIKKTCSPLFKLYSISINVSVIPKPSSGVVYHPCRSFQVLWGMHPKWLYKKRFGLAGISRSRQLLVSICDKFGWFKVKPFWY